MTLKIDRINEKNNTSDFNLVIYKLISQMNFKTAIILFFIYIILNIDIFNTQILYNLNKNYYDPDLDKVSTSGIVVSGLILSIFYIFIDFFNKNEII